MNKNSILQGFAAAINRLFSWADTSQRVNLLSELISATTKDLPPEDSLKVLLDLDNRLYYATGKAAQRYGDGRHPKQRLIRYKEFFVENVRPGERVLDIGCGNGYLCYSIAEAVPDAEVTGFDLNADNLAAAARLHSRDNITFQQGDVYEYKFEKKYDVVIMSAILEHLENRMELLRKVTTETACRTLLIRVPAFDRDWRVALKDELGLEYRLDPTHCLEYTEDKLVEELAAAGMKPEHLHVRWGEIYAAFFPR